MRDFAPGPLGRRQLLHRLLAVGGLVVSGIGSAEARRPVRRKAGQAGRLTGRTAAAGGAGAAAAATGVAADVPPSHAAASVPGLTPAKEGPTLPLPLRQALAASGLPLSAFGLHVQPVEGDGAPLASLNAERAFALASTAKLVTTLAALDLLGPGYRWRTPAFLNGPLHDGRLDGDLLILGGGDALLGSDELLAWFKQLRALGLHEVRGNLVLDRFAFRLTDADMAPTPAPGVDRPHHVWPDALTLNEGRVQLRVQATPAGGAPRLTLWPATAGLQAVAELDTAVGDCQLQAQLQPPESGQSTHRLVLRGQWPAHCGTKEMALAPWSHAQYAQRTVGALWRQAGGRLRGRVAVAATPGRPSGWPVGTDGRPMQAFSVHRSDPLPQVVRGINKTSDNLAARNLLLTLSPGFPWQPATLSAALRRLDDWLAGLGLARGDIAMNNGSGLSREERGRPRAMVHLLRQAWAGPQREAFVRSLPVAGVDGTLAHRMTRGAATGRAFLKTGTLDDARALAGYVQGRSGTLYAVAALVNHPEAQRGLPALDGAIEWLARQG